MRDHVHEVEIQPDWIDYNGHVRDAYYGLAFSQAVDALMIEIGIDAAYRRGTGGTWYVVEDHRRYLREVTATSASLIVHSSVVNRDEKRVHLSQRLYSSEERTPAATGEALQLHVVQYPVPRVVEMPEHVIRRLDQFRDQMTESTNFKLNLKRE